MRLTPAIATWLALSSLLIGCGETTRESAPGTDLVEMIGVDDEAAGYWSRWRGPSGQGIVDDGHQYATQWSTTANVLWRTEVDGFGFSSPVVWGDRVYLTTASPGPDGFWPANGGDRRSLLAYDRDTGELIWETVVPNLRPPEKTNPHNGHASSTPSIDGERIYAYFGNQGLIALDLDGNILWHESLGEFDAFQGTAASPLLYGDMVIISQDHRGKPGSFIAAFDRATGEQRWRTGRGAEVGWGSPVAIRAGGRDQIVLSSSYQVTSYDPVNGKEIWRARGTTVETIPTPVVGESMLFASSGRAGPTLAIRPDGQGDVTDSHIEWQTPKGSPYVSSPLLHEGILYMVNDTTGVATAYVAATGELLWQGRLGGRRRGQAFYSSPVVVNDRIYLSDDTGDTFVLEPGREFRLLGVNSLDETIRASPALVDGVWYIRTQQHLYAIAGDEEIWPETPDPAMTAAAADPSTLFELTPEEKEEGFVKLGNRIDLSDFIMVGGSPDSCEVEGDVIRCHGHPEGYFATRESYENYSLRLDMRFPGEIGNGGFLLHIDGQHQLWPAGVEVQGHYNALGRTFVNTPGAGHGPRADNPEIRSKVILPADEWNSIEIVSRAGWISTFVNGHLIVFFGPSPFRQGPIGIQLEGADLEFRNLRIRRDEPSPKRPAH